MKLLNLKISNFKGIRSFELPLNGGSAIVSGTNGAGKTSLFDAYSWLLFGKDSAGRSETNFEVKPYGSSGLTVEVTGQFEHNGKTFTLGRRLAEKFAKINGDGEADRKPKNEYTYFIDGVPKPKAQYTAYIADICPEETFRLLSDPDYFAGKTDWRTRRKMLLDFFGNTNDRTIIQKHAEEIGELITLIGCKSVQDYKIMSQAERKKVMEDMDGIPARVDEAEKAKPTDLPTEDDGAKLCLLTLRKQTLEQQICDTENGLEVQKQRGVIAELQAEFATRKAEYAMQMTGIKELDEAREQEARLKGNISQTEYEMRIIRAENDRLQNCRAKLLEEYRAISASAFDEASAQCPTCGREYPEKKKQEMRSAFNRRKAGDLEINKTKGLAAREQIQACNDRLTELGAELDGYNQALRQTEDDIARLNSTKSIPFEETADAQALQSRIQREKQTLSDISNDKALCISRWRQEIADLDAELSAIQRRMASAEQVKQQDRRIAQLKAQAKELGKRRAELEHGIELAERFEQIRLTEIEESVNQQFTYARFKLFNRQLNGGIAECCEVTVDGIPYTTNLNTAAKANAGLDIINVISARMGITAPIWLDGAESVVKYLPVEAQTIQLAVDGGSDQLRIYVEE